MYRAQAWNVEAIGATEVGAFLGIADEGALAAVDGNLRKPSDRIEFIPRNAVGPLHWPESTMGPWFEIPWQDARGENYRTRVRYRYRHTPAFRNAVGVLLRLSTNESGAETLAEPDRDGAAGREAL